LPLVNQQTSTLCEHVIKRYRVKCGEYYKRVGQAIFSVQKLYDSTLLYALNAKVDASEYPDFDLLTHIKNTLSYLKSDLEEIKTTKKAQQYLYFFYPQIAAETLKLKVKRYYTDGSCYETTTEIFTTTNAYEVVMIPVGFDALGFDEEDGSGSGSGSGSASGSGSEGEGDDIYKYEVSVLNNVGSRIGKIITYWVREHTENDKVFLYENRWGVFDTLIATGDIERTHEISSDLHRISLDVDYDSTDTEFISQNKDDYPVFKCFTGHYTQEQADEIEAMLAANHFYFIEDNAYKRCILIKSTQTIADTSTNLYSVEFEYRYALN